MFCFVHCVVLLLYCNVFIFICNFVVFTVALHLQFVVLHELLAAVPQCQLQPSLPAFALLSTCSLCIVGMLNKLNCVQQEKQLRGNWTCNRSLVGDVAHGALTDACDRKLVQWFRRRTVRKTCNARRSWSNFSDLNFWKSTSWRKKTKVDKSPTILLLLYLSTFIS